MMDGRSPAPERVVELTGKDAQPDQDMGYDTEHGTRVRGMCDIRAVNHLRNTALVPH